MTQIIKKSLRESATARWFALILISTTMFFAYMFVDVLAPLKDLLEAKRGWSSENFGTVAGSEFVLNVFVFFLIFAGIILDKIGVRRTAILSSSLMVIGASIKLFGVSDAFDPNSGLYKALDGFSLFGLIDALPASAVMACIGFAIFGCGVEMAGITVSKTIVKWFKGKELALAMGLEMAIARLGVFAVFRLSPYLAEGQYITPPVALCTLFLIIGFITFLVYFFLDRKLDKQENIVLNPEDEFKVGDLKTIFTSKTFLIVAGLCVLYYSAIFPFQKFAADMLSSRLEITAKDASNLFSFFPLGAMILTPLLGFFLDKKGKGATMLMIGAILMMTCHLIFALTPVELFTYTIAICAIVILGISFSLVPAALWPSVPKLVDNKVLGSSYAVIFWIQNIGLLTVPIIIGASLDRTNVGVGKNQTEIRAEIENIKNHTETLFLDFKNIDLQDTVGNDVVVPEKSEVKQNIDELALVFRNKEKRENAVQKLQNQVNVFAGKSPKTDETVATITSNLSTISSIEGETIYNYRVPMLIFASFGIMALILGVSLKAEDKRKKYGLELPNIKK